MAMTFTNTSTFLQSLVDFDKDGISAAALKKLRKYTAEENFTPDAAGKASKAAKSLCMWCCAIDEYSAMLSLAHSQAPQDSPRGVTSFVAELVTGAISRLDAPDTPRGLSEEQQAVTTLVLELEGEVTVLQAELEELTRRFESTQSGRVSPVATAITAEMIAVSRPLSSLYICALRRGWLVDLIGGDVGSETASYTS